MNGFDELLRTMNLEFFGKGKHRVKPCEHLYNDEGILLDVRSKEEYETLAIKLFHHLPVMHIPVEEIPDRIDEIPRNKSIGIFCSSGTRAAIVYAYLRLKGFDSDRVKILEGGYQALIQELSTGKILERILTKE